MASTPTTIQDHTPTNFQSQSPLFGNLPGEIRNEIFNLALIQYEDSDEAYPEDSYWYRPGFRGPQKSSSALLRTCKLAYAEGKNVYLRELEWAFWFHRGPDHRTGNAACDHFFSQLSPTAISKLSKVRFFTQMYWLEDGHNLRARMSHVNFRPTTLTITIRYSDWWNWENDAPLKMRMGWLTGFVGSVGLREMRVEYETLVRKREEMMGIVERNKRVEVRLREAGGYLSARGTELMEWRWRGTSRLGGREWRHHGEGETVEYVVVRDTWKHVETEVEHVFDEYVDEEEEDEEDYWEGDEEEYWEGDEDEDENEDEDEEGEDEEGEDDENDEEGSEYEPNRCSLA